MLRRAVVAERSTQTHAIVALEAALGLAKIVALLALGTAIGGAFSR